MRRVGEGICGLAGLRVGSGRASASCGGPAGRLEPFRSERGQGVVEFAMVLPYLAVALLAFIALGRALYYYIQLTHVANEGARIAAVSQKTMPSPYGTIGKYLCSQLPTAIESGSDAAQIAVNYPKVTEAVGDPVTVSVSTNYHLIPFVPAFTLTGAATMRIENPPAATGASYAASETCS
jgi:Flp pilus assembly protein TadG